MEVPSKLPGKTAPRIIADLKVHDPHQHALYNPLRDPHPGYNDACYSTRSSNPTCHHAFTIKSDQSLMKKDNSFWYYHSYGPEAKVAAICQNCLWHVDIIIKFPPKIVVCPKKNFPLHHFVISQPSLPSSADREEYYWRCTECQTLLQVTYRPPRLTLGHQSLLTDPKNLRTRFEAALLKPPPLLKTVFLERGNRVPQTGIQVLELLSSYLQKSLKTNASSLNSIDHIPAYDWRFMSSFGEECDVLLNWLGFKKTTRTYGNDLLHDAWQLPQPSGPNLLNGQVDRMLLEDVLEELYATIRNNSDEGKHISRLQLPLPEPYEVKLRMVLGAEKYDKAVFRLQNFDLIHDKLYAGLGAVGDFSADLLMWAFHCQAGLQPEQSSYFYNCLIGIAETRLSKDLNAEVAMLASQGFVSRAKLVEAFRYLEFKPNDIALASDDEILGRFEARLQNQSRSPETQLWKKLHIIGRARGSLILLNATEHKVQPLGSELAGRKKRKCDNSLIDRTPSKTVGPYSKVPVTGETKECECKEVELVGGYACRHYSKVITSTKSNTPEPPSTGLRMPKSLTPAKSNSITTSTNLSQCRDREHLFTPQLEEGAVHSTGQVICDPDQSENLCAKCKKIDFDSIFDLRIYPMRQLKCCSLSHIDLDHSCPLCHIFRQLRLLELQDGSKAEECKNLMINRAAVIFGTKQLPYTPCLTVSAKSHRRSVILSASYPGDISRLSGRRINRDRIDYGLLKGWLLYCETNHHNALCDNAGVTSTSKITVIDCDTGELVPFSNDFTAYVTLSYVWGSSVQNPQPARFTLPKKVPNTIADAIVVVKNLGFRYLWVDRYCIPQDNEREKHIQLRNMGRIYEESALTIIAAAGVGPEYGLPGVSSTPREDQLAIRIGRHLLVVAISTKVEIRESKWNTRGWTYQEGLLARRRLVFTPNQVYFQCNAMHCVESLSSPLTPLHTSHGVFSASVDFGVAFPLSSDQKRPSKFIDRVNAFMARDLSFDSDAIDAIRGTLALFENIEHPVYNLCGLPIFSKPPFKSGHTLRNIDDLAVALSWTSETPLVRRNDFPSWTWAGWKHKSRTDSDVVSFRYLLDQSFDRERKSYERSLTFPISARVEFGKYKAYEWESDRSQILEKYTAGCYPSSLHIWGWVGNIQLNRYSGVDQMWYWERPQHWGAPKQTIDLNGLSDVKSTEYQVTALVLAVGEQFRPYDARLDLLLLRRHSQFIFHRIGYLSMKCERFIISNSTRASYGSIRLEWTGVILR